MIAPDALTEGLTRVCARADLGMLSGEPQRLTGGAVMESWRFSAGGSDYVLRRAPSLAFMEGRPYGHTTEAALIEAARAKGVTAPEVVAVLEEADGPGSGFIMRALPGTADPKVILTCDDPEGLLKQAARDLARIHRLRQGDVPAGVPVMDYRAAIADLKQQFMDAGGDRPIIALGLKWLEDNCPPQVEPVLNHGDYRMGNLLVEGSTLTGVLDWEIAHFGDRHEDLAFGCMAVWRFARYDRPALGLGSIADYLAAYEAEALERVVISRRTSEQELDLLLLLEEDAPEVERARPVVLPDMSCTYLGEASQEEMATAIAEWLDTLKDKLTGHDRFQLAVARNALGMIAREADLLPMESDYLLSEELLSGEKTLQSSGLLADLRSSALQKLSADVPKYPALKAAQTKWLGEN